MPARGSSGGQKARSYTNAPDIREQSKRKQADSLIPNLMSRVILLSIFSINY